jgi:hypothetical protein
MPLKLQLTTFCDRCVASNQRETGKKRQLRGDNDGFLPKSSCGLSYQACPIPRIVGPSGMAGLRGRRFVFF